jgi:hypothetical protein
MTLLNDMHSNWNAKDNDVRPAIAILHTNGGGYWTAVAKPVQITELKVSYINDECDFGELRVHFNTDSWRPDRDSLIYSDKLFIAELQAYASNVGLAGEDISYSEQGMQGDNYVSCDVGKAFIDSWMANIIAQQNS